MKAKFYIELIDVLTVTIAVLVWLIPVFFVTSIEIDLGFNAHICSFYDASKQVFNVELLRYPVDFFVFIFVPLFGIYLVEKNKTTYPWFLLIGTGICIARGTMEYFLEFNC